MFPCPYCHAALPEPAERFCPNCGGDLEAAPLTQPPAPEAVALPSEASAGASGGVPWERRGEVGFLTSFVETTQQVLFSPARFFSRMPVNGGLGSPLLYALLVGYLSLVVASVYSFVFQMVIGPRHLPALGPHFERVLEFAGGTAGLVTGLLIGPVLIVVQLFIVAGIFHLALLVVGGASKGFEATFRVLAYAGAAGLLELIPFCGRMLFHPGYFLVLTGVGFAKAHQIGGGKAVVAVLLPVLVLCCCCLGLGLVFWGSIAALVQRAQ
ncbi:MAG TPA: YIP1 family protein [Vicinamibacteria bacterium]|nr:YIP1 family protein [Vicinamibacteria bacterium]